MTKIDLQSKPDKVNVSELYEEYRKQSGLDVDFTLVCYGRTLDPSKTLSHYSIRDSSVIYAYKKPEIKLPSNTSSDTSQAGGIDAAELSRFSFSVKSAINEPDFITLIEKLKENREDRENLISVTPGMKDDPLAMAIIQDIDLLNLCLPSDAKSLQEIMNHFPSLITAAGCLADQYHEEHRGSALLGRSRRRPGYGMDEMDDYDGPETGASDATAAGTSDSAGATARAAALRDLFLSQASMLSNVGANTHPSAGTVRAPGAANVPMPQMDISTPRLDRPNVNIAPPAAEITRQMLQNAIQSVHHNLPSHTLPYSSAPTASAPVVSAPVPPAPAPAPSEPRASRDWTAELARMREIGLTDVTLCIQALEATNGDVDAAVNLIFANQ